MSVTCLPPDVLCTIVNHHPALRVPLRCTATTFSNDLPAARHDPCDLLDTVHLAAWVAGCTRVTPRWYERVMRDKNEPVLKYLLETNRAFPVQRVLEAAARWSWCHPMDMTKANHDCVDWLAVGMNAATAGSVVVLQWMCEHEKMHHCFPRYDPTLLATQAVAYGRFMFLEWLYNQDPATLGVPVRTDLLGPATVRRAIEYGDLAMLKWVCARTGLTRNAIGLAVASAAPFEMMEWLRAQGAVMNEWDYAAAANKGHLGHIVWLHAAGCPLDRRLVYAVALQSQHPHVIAWVRTLAH